MIVQHVVNILKETDPVADLIGDRVYPMTWPDEPEYDLIVVQKATGMPEAHQDGPAGIESARVQVDCYSEGGYAAVVALARAVKTKLHAYHGGPETGPGAAPCVIDASFCINDADQPVGETERAGPRLRRRMLEFMIWFKEP